MAPIFRQISVLTNSAYRREVARSISTATMSPAALLYSYRVPGSSMTGYSATMISSWRGCRKVREIRSVGPCGGTCG